MRRFVLIMFFFLLIVWNVSAENITLQNGENSLFYYTILPENDELRSLLLTNPKSTVEQLTKIENLRYLPPYGALNLSLNEPAAVIGYFVFPGSSEYPMVGTFIDPGRGKTFTISQKQIFKNNNNKPLSTPAWKIPSFREPIVIDNRYLDWVGFDPLVQIQESFQPSHYYLQRKDGMKKKQVASNSNWGKGGVRLEQIRIVETDESIYFYFESVTPMDSDVSYFLYGYENQYDEKSIFSIEFPVENPVGFVHLRIRNIPESIICGDLVTGTYLMEARIQKSRLPANFDPLNEAVFLELSSCRYIFSGVEEYIFTQVDPAEVHSVSTNTSNR